MSENNKSQENQKRQFDEDQNKKLLRCSEKKDMTEWNEWRKDNKEISVLLERANLMGAHLEGAYLIEAHLERTNLIGAHLERANLVGAHLEGANLGEAHLERAYLGEAHLEGAILMGAHLEGAILAKAHLERANLGEAHLEGANLIGADLECASLAKAHLEGANLNDANLEGASLAEAHLEGAELRETNLEGADCSSAILDGKTLIWNCNINEETDFTGTGLDSARVEPRLKVKLQGNIRRKQWEEWYEEGSKLKQQYKKLIVKPFWWVSDYGRSTGRIVGCFFGLSIMFAFFYYLFGLIDGQGIIANLFVDYNAQTSNLIPINPYIVPVRAIYFSIVTMTTLGFGDMYAQPGSYLGHILLMIQVLLGYILLGALVTRFAILFTSSGPEKG